jgi:hypothetical protein
MAQPPLARPESLVVNALGRLGHVPGAYSIA